MGAPGESFVQPPHRYPVKQGVSPASASEERRTAERDRRESSVDCGHVRRMSVFGRRRTDCRDYTTLPRTSAATLTTDTSPADMVTAPPHYTKGSIQPRTYIRANNMPWAEGNVVKYTTRHKWKGRAQDIRKAIENLKDILREEYGEEL